MDTRAAMDASPYYAESDSLLKSAWNAYNIPVVSGDAFFTERHGLRIDCTFHEENRVELVALLRNWKLPADANVLGDDATSTFDLGRLSLPEKLRVIVAQAKWSGLVSLDSKVTDFLGREEALLPILNKLWLVLTRKEGHQDRQIAPRLIWLERELHVKFIQARSAFLFPTLPSSLHEDLDQLTSWSRTAATIRKDIADAEQTALTSVDLASQASIYNKTIVLYVPSSGSGVVFYAPSDLILSYEGSKFDAIQGTAQKIVKARFRRTASAEDTLTLTTFQTEPEWREKEFMGRRTIEWRFFMRKKDARGVSEADRFSYDVRLRMTLGMRGEVSLNFELPGRWFGRGDSRAPKRLSCWGRIGPAPSEGPDIVVSSGNAVV